MSGADGLFNYSYSEKGDADSASKMSSKSGNGIVIVTGNVPDVHPDNNGGIDTVSVGSRDILGMSVKDGQGGFENQHGEVEEVNGEYAVKEEVYEEEEASKRVEIKDRDENGEGAEDDEHHNNATDGIDNNDDDLYAGFDDFVYDETEAIQGMIGGEGAYDNHGDNYAYDNNDHEHEPGNRSRVDESGRNGDGYDSARINDKTTGADYNYQDRRRDGEGKGGGDGDGLGRVRGPHSMSFEEYNHASHTNAAMGSRTKGSKVSAMIRKGGNQGRGMGYTSDSNQRTHASQHQQYKYSTAVSPPKSRSRSLKPATSLSPPPGPRPPFFPSSPTPKGTISAISFYNPNRHAVSSSPSRRRKLQGHPGNGSGASGYRDGFADQYGRHPSSSSIIVCTAEASKLTAHSDKTPPRMKSKYADLSIFRSPNVRQIHGNKNEFDPNTLAWRPTKQTGKYNERFQYAPDLAIMSKINAVFLGDVSNTE
jgi:hypothetical protein